MVDVIPQKAVVCAGGPLTQTRYCHIVTIVSREGLYQGVWKKSIIGIKPRKASGNDEAIFFKNYTGLVGLEEIKKIQSRRAKESRGGRGYEKGDFVVE